jgi:hypothetical protein
VYPLFLVKAASDVIRSLSFGRQAGQVCSGIEQTCTAGKEKGKINWERKGGEEG